MIQLFKGTHEGAVRQLLGARYVFTVPSEVNWGVHTWNIQSPKGGITSHCTMLGNSSDTLDLKEISRLLFTRIIY